MTDNPIKSAGLNGRQLATLTGQSENTVSRKRRRDQGLAFGPREAGILAAWSTMDEDQRAAAWTEFEQLVADFKDE